MWIVGNIANNTRVDETFKGIIAALKEVKPEYPIVIRRAGPGEKEGFSAMKQLAEEEKLDIHLYGAETKMTETAKLMVELSEEYKKKKAGK